MTAKGGDWGHEIAIEKLESAAWVEGQGWQIKGNVKDVYSIAGEETPGVSKPGSEPRSFQIIQAYETPEGEPGAVMGIGAKHPEEAK